MSAVSAVEVAQGLSLKFVVQRAIDASVVIQGESRGHMSSGLVVLVGAGLSENAVFTQAELDDSLFEQVEKMWGPIFEKCVEKILGLRIFEDENGKMNLSVSDKSGGVYLISQFTLFADCKKGFRPSFTRALKPSWSKPFYEILLKKFEAKHQYVLSGVFGADMKVAFTNDGPVTIAFEAKVSGLV